MGQSSQELKDSVTTKARELGFHKIGFAPIDHADPEGRLRAWLDRGFDADMDYMARTAKERADPRLLIEGARSVIALSISYYRPEVKPRAPMKVSRYAVSEDYHKVIRKRVRKLRRHILTLLPNAKVKPTVDTSPVLEREWARRAGIAWIGKSTMAIAQDLGTYTFLATLITDVDFRYDTPHLDRCGTCTKCLDACPTDAFVGPYQLDANRCITYWNVEHREEFTSATPPLHDWVAGCDICQEVCPWNKFARPADEDMFVPRPALESPDVQTFSRQNLDGALTETLKGTPLQRTGSKAIRRNALRVLGHEDQK